MIINPMVYSSGGGSLDLNVVAYSSAFPSSAPTNTVGIITANAITSYTFSATEPSTPSEGMVWIRTGNESTTPIPVDSNGSAYLYPICAKQYLSGAWSAIDSANVKCYQSGWKMWRKYIFNEGDTCGYEYGSGGQGSMSIYDGKMRAVGGIRVATNPYITTSYHSTMVVEYDVINTLSSTDTQRAFGLNDVYNTASATPPGYACSSFDKNVGVHKSSLALDSTLSVNKYLKIFVASGTLDVYSIYLEG